MLDVHKMGYTVPDLSSYPTSSLANYCTLNNQILSLLLLGQARASSTLIITMAPTWSNGIFTLVTIYPMFIALWLPRFMYTLNCIHSDYINVVHVCDEQLPSLLKQGAIHCVLLSIIHYPLSSI